MRGDTLQLAENLRAVAGALVRSAQQAGQLPSAEAAVLGMLDRDGPQTTAQLAHARGVKHQSVAKIVKQLAEARLVEKAPHATDRRMTLLRITATGRAALRADRRRRADWLASAIRAELDAGQQADLARCVAIMARLAAHRGPAE
jgi:DNA-binding MarR family transcriptional regulator